MIVVHVVAALGVAAAAVAAALALRDVGHVLNRIDERLDDERPDDEG